MFVQTLLYRGARTIYHGTTLRYIHRSSRLDKLTTFKLSDIGEGISEVELIKWNKAIGDDIEEMETVCTVQSDKSAVDITSRYTGIVKKLYVDAGEMIKIGAPLMDIETEEEATVTHSGGSAKTGAPSQEKASQPPPPRFQRTTADRLNASPAVRHLAKQLGVDLEKVTPTGSMGQVTKEDVEKAAGGATKAPESGMPGEFVKLNAVGRGMVKSMVASLQVPHVTVGEDLDLTEVKALYQMKRAEEKGFKLTMTPFMLKALSLALKEHPTMNSKFCGDGYIKFSVHNVNVAVATDNGLMVPVIRNVESKTIRELQLDLLRLQKLAEEMRLSPDDIKGGTITLSNLGAIGGTYVKALLFDGQGAILALGAARKQPCYVDEKLVPREIAPMGVTADHRHLDGATIARFAATFKTILQDPEILKQHY